MRVLILAPSVFPHVTGNAVTVERWRRALSREGVAVEVLSAQTTAPAAFVECLRRFSPDVIHVHHAFRAGTLLLDPSVAAACTGCAVVISPGGTDINVDLEVPDRERAVAAVFRMARAVIVQSKETADHLRRRMPDADRKFAFVPKAVCWFGDEPYDLRKIAGCDHGNLIFFLPAGIRPVKGNLECLQAMEKVHVARPPVRFVVAGPAITAEYAGRFEREVRRLSTFAVWIDGIPPAAMRSAYEASDIVVNASFSEGLSNSLLEALAGGRPVLASNIPGNWWPVLGSSGDAPAGLLFDPYDAGAFLENALRLTDGPDLRSEFGQASRSRGMSLPSPEDEADGLVAAYEKALGARIP